VYFARDRILGMRLISLPPLATTSSTADGFGRRQHARMYTSAVWAPNTSCTPARNRLTEEPKSPGWHIAILYNFYVYTRIWVNLNFPMTFFDKRVLLQPRKTGHSTGPRATGTETKQDVSQLLCPLAPNPPAHILVSAWSKIATVSPLLGRLHRRKSRLPSIVLSVSWTIMLNAFSTFFAFCFMCHAVILLIEFDVLLPLQTRVLTYSWILI
jgi:hypothetical protein